MNNIEEANSLEKLVQRIKSNPTKSSFFIRAMLGFSNTFWESESYLNTYITLNPDCMYIVFLKDNSSRANYIKTTLENNSNYICTYENENFIAYRMMIPINFNNDFYKILEGRYSQTKEDYKDLVLRVNSNTSQSLYDRIKSGLYVTKAAIKELEEKLGCELYVKEVISKPDMEKETFNPLLFNLEDAKI